MISCTSGCLSASFCISLLNWTRQGSTMVACENPNTYFLPWAFIWNGLNTVEAAAAAILVLMNVLRFMGGYYSSSFVDLNSHSGNSGKSVRNSGKSVLVIEGLRAVEH